MMIVSHHQWAINMSQARIDHGKDRQMISAAKKIIAAQRKEITMFEAKSAHAMRIVAQVLRRKAISPNAGASSSHDRLNEPNESLGGKLQTEGGQSVFRKGSCLAAVGPYN